MERRDLTARAARDRLAVLIEVRPSRLARLNEEQAAAVADQLTALRSRRPRTRRISSGTA